MAEETVIQIIQPSDLVSYPAAGGVSLSDARQYVDLVNALITEAWANPVDPVPTWVKAIALEAAARPARNPKGLVSWTRSVDDASRTERVSEAAAARVGVYLTDDDIARLSGARRRRARYGTIRVRQGF